MPGSISDSNNGPSDRSPYVPSWCYPKGPKMCLCGHHEGYHNDSGECLLCHECSCTGMANELKTPIEEM